MTCLHLMLGALLVKTNAQTDGNNIAVANEVPAALMIEEIDDANEVPAALMIEEIDGANEVPSGDDISTGGDTNILAVGASQTVTLGSQQSKVDVIQSRQIWTQSRLMKLFLSMSLNDYVYETMEEWSAEIDSEGYYRGESANLGVYLNFGTPLDDKMALNDILSMLNGASVDDAFFANPLVSSVDVKPPSIRQLFDINSAGSYKPYFFGVEISMDSSFEVSQEKLEDTVLDIASRLEDYVPEVVSDYIDDYSWNKDNRDDSITDTQSDRRLRVMFFHNLDSVKDVEIKVDTKDVHRIAIHSLTNSMMMPGLIFKQFCHLFLDLNDPIGRDSNSGLGALDALSHPLGLSSLDAHTCTCSLNVNNGAFPPRLNAVDRTIVGWSVPQLISSSRMVHLKDETMSTRKGGKLHRSAVFLPGLNRLQSIKLVKDMQEEDKQNIQRLFKKLMKRLDDKIDNVTTDGVQLSSSDLQGIESYLTNRGSDTNQLTVRGEILENWHLVPYISEMLLLEVREPSTVDPCVPGNGGTVVYHVDPMVVCHPGLIGREGLEDCVTGDDDVSPGTYLSPYDDTQTFSGHSSWPHVHAPVQILYSNVQNRSLPGPSEVTHVWQTPARLPLDQLSDTLNIGYHASTYQPQELLRIDQAINLESDLNFPGTKATVVKVINVATDNDQFNRDVDLCNVTIQSSRRERSRPYNLDDQECVAQCKLVFSSFVFQQYCADLGFDSHNVGCVSECISTITDCEVVESAPVKCDSHCHKYLKYNWRKRNAIDSYDRYIYSISDSEIYSQQDCNSQCESIIRKSLFWAEACHSMVDDFIPHDAQSAAKCYTAIFGEDQCMLAGDYYEKNGLEFGMFLFVILWFVVMTFLVPHWMTTKGMKKKDAKYLDIMDQLKC
eukprot:GHVH01001237.1.p1 GENE.GHVH01001237.1~~GHVH01001237.1.p1  ORF type:complete len:890 (-),score=119.18 GHVH01001237.1:22-2691(-)